jgi:hypothetical protein
MSDSATPATPWTPGPWLLDGDFDDCVDVSITDSEGFPFAEVSPMDGEDMDEWSHRSRGNAQLISAAPDLYSALFDLNAVFCSVLNSQPGWYALYLNELNAASAAMRKALPEVTSAALRKAYAEPGDASDAEAVVEFGDEEIRKVQPFLRGDVVRANGQEVFVLGSFADHYGVVKPYECRHHMEYRLWKHPSGKVSWWRLAELQMVSPRTHASITKLEIEILHNSMKIAGLC